MKRRNYTEAEDALILSMKAEGRTHTEIAGVLGRTWPSIGARIQHLRTEDDRAKYVPPANAVEFGATPVATLPPDEREAAIDEWYAEKLPRGYNGKWRYENISRKEAAVVRAR